ncbi:hypothetical protein [Baekduia sp. Peel2402]|uniref:hypothetical protein n=1 Tax=Baekduia sp. Peel2402 TaxID=3458296 RepID=UPI00403E8153
MLSIRKSIRAAIAASVAALAMAGTAGAVTLDHYLQGQNIGPGNTFAGYNAHTNPWQSATTSDHTACPSYDVGHGGYFSGAPADFTLSTCGPGTSYWNVSHGGSWHGAAFNPNGATTDYIYDAYVGW